MILHLQRMKLAAGLAALALGGGVGLAAANFRDPVGDVRGGAGPDVISINVTHTRSTVTFRVGFAKAPPLSRSASARWMDVLLVGIDVPPRGLERGAAGWSGVDYFAGVHGADKTGLLVKMSAGPPHRATVVARPKVVVTGRTLSFTVQRTALADPASFDFVAAAGRETSSQTSGGGSDEAPNRGSFHYELK